MTPTAEKQLSYNISTHAIERLAPSKQALDCCRQIAEGKTGADQAVQQVLKGYGFQRPTHG